MTVRPPSIALGSKRPRLLIVGCGDVGMRVLRLLGGRWRVMALSSSTERLELLRRAGTTPVLGNLDQPASLARLAGWADRVLHLAPPQASGPEDLRTRHLLQALALGSAPRRIVYASTTGVYGDCAAVLIRGPARRPPIGRAAGLMPSGNCAGLATSSAPR